MKIQTVILTAGLTIASLLSVTAHASGLQNTHQYEHKQPPKAEQSSKGVKQNRQQPPKQNDRQAPPPKAEQSSKGLKQNRQQPPKQNDRQAPPPKAEQSSKGLKQNNQQAKERYQAQNPEHREFQR